MFQCHAEATFKNLLSTLRRLLQNSIQKAFLLLTVALPQLVLSNGILADQIDLPNIVFILVDDMGYGDPGCFNPQSKIRTPYMDGVAKSGMKFLDAHAPGPLCHMSRYGLMTGRYPFRTDVSRWPKHALIEPKQTTLASMLRHQGYQTAMVGKWHLGFEEDSYDKPLPGGPVDVGFDSFFGIRASTDIPPYFYIRGDHAVKPPTVPIAANNSDGWSPIQGAFWRAGLIAPDMQLKDVLPQFTDEAIQVIEQHQKNKVNIKGADAKPLFLYLAYPAPHTPWLPSPEFAGKSQAGVYGDFLEMVDAMIGRVLGKLDEAGMRDNTLLVITSDNGPTWYEVDVERFGHDASGGWRGMKADAWEAGHRVPLVARWPGVVSPGTSTDQLMCFTDFLATFATITGFHLTTDELPDSFDFSKTLRGESIEKSQMRTALPLQSGGGFMTLRSGDWKLIEGLGSGGFSEPKRLKRQPDGPEGQLYHLKDDPTEATNLWQKYPDVVKRMRAELNSY